MAGGSAFAGAEPLYSASAVVEQQVSELVRQTTKVSGKSLDTLPANEKARVDFAVNAVRSVLQTPRQQMLAQLRKQAKDDKRFIENLIDLAVSDERAIHVTAGLVLSEMADADIRRDIETYMQAHKLPEARANNLIEIIKVAIQGSAAPVCPQ